MKSRIVFSLYVFLMHLYYAHSIRWAHTPGERTPHDILPLLHERWHTVSSEEFYTNLDPTMSDKLIYTRDIGMLHESDLILVNVTNPSLGVGYEIGYAEALGKPIICFYQASLVKSVSAMITGNPHFPTYGIAQIEELHQIIVNLK